MKTSSFLGAALAFLSAQVVLVAGNPFGIDEGVQTFTLKFASEAQAKEAKLSPSAIPFGKKLAASARWDDTNPKHLDTRAAMVRNGWKGTFYLNASRKGFDAEYCGKLIEGGCSIGVHTQTHPSLQLLNPNEIFYEMMANRLEREADSDSPVDTLAFPYNQYSSPIDKDAQLEIGKAMRNAGLFGVPTAYGTRFVLEEALGYPKGTLAESALVRPGDRDVSIEEGEKHLKQALADSAHMAANPCVCVGIHSWHTADGIKKLDEFFKLYSRRPDFWYCNENEYASYRLEANTCSIKKEVKGDEALFTVTRLAPNGLGAAVPLWLETSVKPLSVASGSAALKTEGGKDFLELPPLAGAPVPSVIATVECPADLKAGIPMQRSPEMPELGALLQANPLNPGKLALLLGNDGKSALENISVVFRAPSGWTHGVLCEKLAKLAPGERKAVEADMGALPKDVRHHVGRPFFVAQVDFMDGGKAKRLYATIRYPALQPPSDCPTLALRTFAPLEGAFDFAKLSEPGASLDALSAKELPVDVSKASPRAVFFNIRRDAPPAGSFESAALYEFESADGSPLSLVADKDARFFLNGAEVKGAPGSRKLTPKAGVNRLLVVFSNEKGKFAGRYILWDGKLKFLPAKKS